MILIIDLENTCLHEDERPAGYHGQIIEIGAAWVTLEGVVEETFEVFVQAENPVTEFCTELTGITQKDVDTGLPFAEAMKALAEFSSKHPGQTWGSWGNADINSINFDCAYHGVESPLKGWTHRNLKKEWSAPRRAIIRERFGPKANKQAGMARALEIAGIELEGPHHRALADVLNIAKLLPGCALPADTAEEVEDPAKPETEFQRLVREKKESQIRQIQALRNATPEQRKAAMESLKKALRGDGVPPLPKLPRPKYNFDY
jgi:inhibitor of KinA sporulation pathway (predicted exonuclease)